MTQRFALFLALSLTLTAVGVTPAFSQSSSDAALKSQLEQLDALKARLTEQLAQLEKLIAEKRCDKPTATSATGISVLGSASCGTGSCEASACEASTSVATITTDTTVTTDASCSTACSSPAAVVATTVTACPPGQAIGTEVTQQKAFDSRDRATVLGLRATDAAQTPPKAKKSQRRVFQMQGKDGTLDAIVVLEDDNKQDKTIEWMVPPTAQRAGGQPMAFSWTPAAPTTPSPSKSCCCCCCCGGQGKAQGQARSAAPSGNTMFFAKPDVAAPRAQGVPRDLTLPRRALAAPRAQRAPRAHAAQGRFDRRLLPRPNVTRDFLLSPEANSQIDGNIRVEIRIVDENGNVTERVIQGKSDAKAKKAKKAKAKKKATRRSTRKTSAGTKSDAERIY